MGLIKATHFDIDLARNLVDSSRNNKHDRIARSMMCAIGLMSLNNREKVMDLYHEIITDKDPIVRMGAVNMISMAYVNTSSH